MAVMRIEDYRKQYPEMDDMSDGGLSRFLYDEYGSQSNMSYEDFDRAFRGNTKPYSDPAEMDYAEKAMRVGGSQGAGAIEGAALTLVNKPIGSLLNAADWAAEKVTGKNPEMYEWWDQKMQKPLEENLQRRHEFAAEAEEGMGWAGKQGIRTAGMAGHMAPTVAMDLMTGGALEAATAGRMGAQATEVAANIPKFAKGMGVRGLVEGSYEGAEEDGVLGAVRGGVEGMLTKTAEGMLMHKVGSMGNMHMETDVTSGLELPVGEATGFMGRLGRQVPGQAGVALGLGTSETIGRQGRLPTLQEAADMATQGAIMGAGFATFPTAFDYVTKAGKKVFRAIAPADAITINEAIKRWGGGDIPEDIKSIGDNKLEITFKDGVKTIVSIPESGDAVITDYKPSDANVKTIHQGPSTADVVAGKQPETIVPAELPGRSEMVPSHLGESAPLPARGTGATLPPRRSTWEPATEMNPQAESKGKAGVPLNKAPRPQKLQTEIQSGRDLPDLNEFRKEVQKRYGKEPTEQEQLTFFQQDEGVLRRSQAKKDHLKFVVDAAMHNGDIIPGDLVRTTSLRELYTIFKSGSLREGSNFEGGTGISAYEMGKNFKGSDMAAMGKYSDAIQDHPVAIVFPKEAGVGKGMGVNEILIHPEFDPNAAKFIIAGQSKLLAFGEVEAAMKELVQADRRGELRFAQEDGEFDSQVLLDMMLPEVRPENYPTIKGRKEFYDIVMQTYGLTHPKTNALISMTDIFGKVWMEKALNETGKPQTMDTFYETIGAGGIKMEGLGEVEGLPRGAVKIMEDGRAVLFALKDPDFSTALHELVHVGKHHVASTADMMKLEAAYGVNNGEWDDVAEENMARDFEGWTMTGEVSNPELKPLFNKIQKWMTDVYSEAKDKPGVEVSPEASEVFDRWAGRDLPNAAHAEAILELHRENQGSTYNIAHGESRGGRRETAVGVLGDRAVQISGEPTKADIELFIKDNAETLADPRFNVGTWVDGDTGNTVLDISVTVPEEWKAVALAKKFNQKATYNLANGEELQTGGTGEGTGETPLEVMAYLSELDNDKPYALVRYMKDGSIESADPRDADLRTDIRGAEHGRVVDNPEAPARLHYYHDGQAEEAEVARLPYKYRTEVPSKKIYDWAEDPDGYRQLAVREGMGVYDMGLAELMMKEDGYWGYHTPGGQWPSTVVVFEQLPVRELTAHSAANALEAMGVPKNLEGVSLRNLTPEAWTHLGRVHGIEKALGPVSELRAIEDVHGNGKEYHIPGGVDGEFTWLDMFYIKSQAWNPAKMSPELHAMIQKKFSRTMEAGAKDPMQVFNNMLFAQLSPNAGLTTNQMAYSRMRAPDMETVRELASWADKLGDNPTKAERLEMSEEMRKAFGLHEVKADEVTLDMFPKEGDFGIGYSGTQDLTYVAEFARLFEQNPEWFIKGDQEGWYEYTERIASQVPGFGTKVAAFGGVWQDPVRAAIGAIDRHMVRRLEDIVFLTKKERTEWRNNIIKRWNNKKINKGVKDAKSIKSVMKTGPGRKFFSDELLKLTDAKDVTLRTPKGEFGKNVPEHMKQIKWIEEPIKVKVTNPRYKLAMEEVQRRGQAYDLGAFSSQHMIWDRIRNRLEPHESLFPGLYKLPKLSLEQTRKAREAHAKAGFFPEGDTPVKGGVPMEELVFMQEEMGKPAADTGKLVNMKPEELRSHLESELERLGQDAFNDIYNDAKVGSKAVQEYMNKSKLPFKEAKMFIQDKISKYKVAYDNIAGAEEARRRQKQAEAEGVLFQRDKNFSPKERRVQADVRAHAQEMRTEAPAPSEVQGPLAKYMDFIDQGYDYLVRDKLYQFLEKTPYDVGGKIIRAVDRDYRGKMKNSDEYVTSMDEMRQYQNLGKTYALDIGSRLMGHAEDVQLQIGDVLRGKKNIGDLPEGARGDALEAQQMLIKLGREAVKYGLLGEETFFKNYGKYFPRMYAAKEYQTLIDRFGIQAPDRLEMSRFKKRGDIPKEIREELGEIMTPGYPVAKAIGQITHDIEMAKHFKGIASNPDWAVPENVRWIKTKKGRPPVKENIPLPPEVQNEIAEKGFKKLPDSKKLGALQNAWVHEEIYHDLMAFTKVDSGAMKTWKKTLGLWKGGKVILSFKTHMRNIFSNSLLAHLGGMPMYEQAGYLKRAIKEVREGRGEYHDLAFQNGLLDAGWQRGELGEMFEKTVEQELGLKHTGPEHEPNAVLDTFGKLYGGLKKGGHKAARLYEMEEQVFKVAKMMHNMERRGMDAKTAAKDAEKWLFNYSKLTRAQEAYKHSPMGAPFATFAFKSLPRIGEALVKTPWRFALPIAMIHAVQGMAGALIGDTKEEQAAKREMLPEWMKGGLLPGAKDLIPNFVRFPLTDKHGREYWLNLTYMMPWGDLGEGGGFGPIPGSLMPFTQPLVKDAIAQFRNHDEFWDAPIVKPEDTAGKEGFDKFLAAAKARGKHAFQSLSPTPAIDALKGYDAFQGRPDYKGRQRAGLAVAMDVFGGVKTYPVDYLEQMERKIYELDPNSGKEARNIKSKLKTLYVKRAAMEDMGKDTEYYDTRIEAYHQQIMGLARKLQGWSETFSETGM